MSTRTRWRGAGAAGLPSVARAPHPAFLGSEDGRWVNGRVIRANGVVGSRTQGPQTRDFTNARRGGKRRADQVNINSWRSS